MKHLNIIRITMLFFCSSIMFSCSKQETDQLIVAEKTEISNALKEFKQTSDFTKLNVDYKIDFNDIQFIDSPNGKNIKVLALPFKSGADKVKFAAIYTSGNSTFDSPSAKTLIFEINSTDRKSVREAVQAKQFNGEVIIYNTKNEEIYSVEYNQNLVVNGKGYSSIITNGDGRGSACSADGIGYCTGQKMENMGFFESVSCYTNIVICVAAYAADCAIENCPEQPLLN